MLIGENIQLTDVIAWTHGSQLNRSLLMCGVAAEQRNRDVGLGNLPLPTDMQLMFLWPVGGEKFGCFNLVASEFGLQICGYTFFCVRCDDKEHAFIADTHPLIINTGKYISLTLFGLSMLVSDNITYHREPTNQKKRAADDHDDKVKKSPRKHESNSKSPTATPKKWKWQIPTPTTITQVGRSDTLASFSGSRGEPGSEATDTFLMIVIYTVQ